MKDVTIIRHDCVMVEDEITGERDEDYALVTLTAKMSVWRDIQKYIESKYTIEVEPKERD